jgi:flagellar assembly factor FliW
MKVNTLRFGELEVDESKLFHFPMGILGFSSCKSFIIIESEGTYPFKWMQSIDDPSTAFVLGDPLLFYPSYCASIKRDELNSLEPIQEKDLVLSVIMTVPSNPQEVSANLCAPLIFNLANRRVMQYVLNDSRYPVKHFLFKDVSPPLPKQITEAKGDARSLSLR